jgi:hypothetical protein
MVNRAFISALAVISYCALSVWACGGAAGGAAAGAAGAAGHAGLHLGEIAHGMVITGGKCIYEEAHVRLASGETKRVKHLEPGDNVLAYSPEKGVHSSPVIGELHRDSETTVTIVEIETSSGRRIPVTPMHSLFVRPCFSSGSSWTAKAAFEVSSGECVPRYHSNEGDVAEESITNVRTFEARGIRQPLTETGTIVVDDVVISCYDRVVNQDATHIALFPYRWIMSVGKTYAAQFESLLPALYNLITFDSSLF